MFQIVSLADTRRASFFSRRFWHPLVVYMLVAGLLLAHPLHDIFQVNWARLGQALRPLPATGSAGAVSGGCPLPAVTWISVPLVDASLLPGWGGVAGEVWLVPSGLTPVTAGWTRPPLPGGEPWKVQGQVIVKDPVLISLRRVYNALKQMLLNTQIATEYKTAAWKAKQAAAHHTQQQAQERWQHVQNVMQRTRQVLAAGKQTVVSARQLLTQQGIFAILREQLSMSDDIRKVIVNVYDIWQKTSDLRATAEEALYTALEVPAFVMDYRNWYRDANPQTVLAALENFVMTANPAAPQQTSTLIKTLVETDPDMQVKVETYFSLSAQALEKAKIIEELKKKIPAHRQKLDNPNPATGKSEEELTVLNNRKDTPDNPPPAGSPQRDTAGVTDTYPQTVIDEQDKLDKIEGKVVDVAKEITEEVSAFELEYQRLMEQLAYEMTEKDLEAYFSRSQDNGCLDPFCLAIRLFYLR